MKAETLADLPRIKGRMLRWMIALTILGAIATLATSRFQVAPAFVVGAFLGILNFRWLWRTGEVLLDIPTAHLPRKTLFLIVLRYPLIFAALVILYCTGWLRPLPVIIGLLVPSIGVLFESFSLVYADLHGKQTV
jgi:hypothetical protein